MNLPELGNKIITTGNPNMVNIKIDISTVVLAAYS